MKYLLTTILFVMLAQPLAMAEALHSAGTGDIIDYGLDFDGHSITLYLANKDSNQPLNSVDPKITFDDETEVLFKETKHLGVYVAEEVNLGSKKLTNGELLIYINGEAELLEITSTESDADEHLATEEAASWFESIPLVVVGFLLLIVGFLIGSFIRKDSGNLSEKALIMIMSLGMFGYSNTSKAHEGHSHGHVEVGGETNGSVKMSKKAQFLINLNTIKAVAGEHHTSLKTIGHISPDPSKLSLITAPRDGFLVNIKAGVLGKYVEKGTVLAQLESIGRVSLRAPISGIVMNMKMVNGARVSAGEQLVKIVDNSSAWIDAEIFQEDLAKIKDFKKAYIALPGTTKVYEATLVGSLPEVNEATLSGKVYLEIDNTDSKLPMGSLVEISIDIEGSDSTQGFKVPKRAVLNRGGEQLVFVKVDAERFEPKAVRVISGAKPDEVIVTKGLVNNDLIVVNGNYQLLIGIK